tara:strand:- start:348 stop:1133 length:786 start_codon:yes stop_codon:yes gene_type:complete
MFGNYFYHQRIRKAVATFGAMFNDIYVLRKDAAGGVISTQKVPLSYGPRAKFLDRIREVPDLEERRVAIKLPRMSFEIMNISYDPARQLPKGNITARPGVAGTVLSRNKIEVGVPYIISFQLSVFAKLQDDALQCVEQVIPFFNPQYTLTIKPFDDIDTIKEDVPIILTGVTMNDDYEGEVAARRTIVYTLDFDMHVYFHGPVTSSGIIRSAITDVLDINAGLNDSDVPLERITVTPNPSDASPDSDFGFTTNILGIDSAL